MKSFLKNCFVSGALVLVPIVLTFWILRALILWGDDLFHSFVPAYFRTIIFFGYEIPGMGLLFTLILIFLTGVLTRLYFGKKLIALGDWILHKIPFGSGIYGSIKQLLNAIVATGGKKSFQQVVLAEFPKRGNYVVGFVTGDTAVMIQKHLKKPTVTVFVPTAPNPTSGFLIVTPKENITPLDISAEKAFKFIISGGTVQG